MFHRLKNKFDFEKFRKKLFEYASESDPKKAALAVTLGICLGVIPFLGFTFILVALTGYFLRLNQVIIQTAHVLVSPFQLSFIYPFMMVGQYLFGGGNYQLIGKIRYAVRSDFLSSLREFSGIILSGIGAWLIIMLIFGTIFYRLLLMALMRKGFSGQVE